MTNNIQNTQIDFIQKRFNISALLSGIVLIGFGAFLFIYSSNMDGNMLSSALIFFGIVSVVFALFLLVARLNVEVYAKTNSPIVRRQIYFDAADFYNIKSAIENDKLEKVSKKNLVKDITAYRMVSNYVKVNSNNKFIFVVHRLDQDTSGILMFCKNEKIRDKMQDNWNNVVKKRGYVTVVDGKLSGNGTFRSFLMEDRRQFVYSSKSGIGKEAITHYSVLKNNNNYSMLQVFIDTGRRNQIRVHLSEMGYPIVGDKKYGCKTNPLKRLCLHANRLEFIHPTTKENMTFKAERTG